MLQNSREEVWRRASKRDFYGRTVTLKVKYADFKEASKRRTIPKPIEDFYT
jgi:DNA polymerase-4